MVLNFSFVVEVCRRRDATIMFKTTGLAYSYCNTRCVVRSKAASSRFS